MNTCAEQKTREIEKAVSEVLSYLLQRYSIGWELWIKCDTNGNVRIKETGDRSYSSG
jgi:hypothetical protein